MMEWLRRPDGARAILLGAERERRLEAALYAFVYKDAAYYGSAPGFVPDAMHALQWRAILVLKTMGVRWYELGWQARPGDSDKDRQISFFKRGFGGVDVAVPAVERIHKEGVDAHRVGP